MPPPRPPPTPSSSTDLAAEEARPHQPDMESAFALPPPALTSNANHGPSNSSKSGIRNGTTKTQATPPQSPHDKPANNPSPRLKRTLSGAAKQKDEAVASPSYALPPPPSRARKIIQMKPKSSNPPSSASETAKATNATTTKTTATSTAAGSKRKQPSANSAAGRKIARKTAHSIIERRRRSKMNEEFCVLKNMIPACEGVEMHKLAILQAGIEYLRYLEGCVTQLKGENVQRGPTLPMSEPQFDQKREAEEEEGEDGDEDEDDMDEGEEADAEAEEFHDDRSTTSKRPATAQNTNWRTQSSRPNSLVTTSSSSFSSPIVHANAWTTDSRNQRYTTLPGTHSFSASPSSFAIPSASATPTPTLLSPAFNAIHFSPDLARVGTNSTVATSLSSNNSASFSSMEKPSPNLLSLPRAALPLPNKRNEDNKSPGLSDGSSGVAEATATAALMMLTNDRRGPPPTSARTDGLATLQKSKSISVKDLLSS